MSLETGKIYNGKVRNIAPYGAFVEIALEGKVYVGMVHISEISNTYVNEIRDHLTEGKEVKVKVLSIDENGKTSLSIKKASDDPAPRQKFQGQKPGGGSQRTSGNNNNNYKNNNSGNDNKPAGNRQQQAPVNSFEDMLSKFKQSSEEKMSDLKRNIDSKRRSARRGK